MSAFISLAYNYWQLVRNSIEEMELQSNSTHIVSKYDETKGNDWSTFEEKTKWNDNNIGIPLLFNFYHGIELFMKGLLELKEIDFDTNHNLHQLYQLIKDNEQVYEKKIVNRLKKIIFDFHELKVFFNNNKIDASKFYECFKYPISKNNFTFYYGSIRGKEDLTFEIYKKIHSTTIDFWNLMIMWRVPKEIQNEYLKKQKYV
jgi:hypothetical protein